MAPHAVYAEPDCPHPGCNQRIEAVDFQIELHPDAALIYQPLTLAYFRGDGFAGRCPGCSRWIWFRLAGRALKVAITEDQSLQLSRLPDDWAQYALFFG